MLCCICGETIELGDLFVQVSQYRLGLSVQAGRTLFEPFRMEDGSFNKFAHSLCPALSGAPLSLVGADPHDMKPES